MLNDQLSWAATVTTVAIMFTVLLKLQPLLHGLQDVYFIPSIVAGSVASLGIYRSLATGLLWLFGRSVRLRELSTGDILGFHSDHDLSITGM